MNILFSVQTSVVFLIRLSAKTSSFSVIEFRIMFLFLVFFVFVDASDDQPPPPPPPLQPVRAADEGRDLLTCGQCSRAFPLAHILAFIQHKQGDCRSQSRVPDASAAPRSPANRAQQSLSSAEPRPGYIELRRGAARERAWGEEPGLQEERGRTGE